MSAHQPNVLTLAQPLVSLLYYFDCVSSYAEEHTSADMVMELETNEEATNDANLQASMWAQDTGVDLFP